MLGCNRTQIGSDAGFDAAVAEARLKRTSNATGSGTPANVPRIDRDYTKHGQKVMSINNASPSSDALRMPRFIGCLLMVLSGIMILHQTGRQISWTPTTGTVTQTQICTSSDSGERIAVIEYTPGNGATYTVKSGCAYPHPDIGDRLPVLFNPHNPEKACDASFLNVWLVPVILLFTGFMLFMVKREIKSNNADEVRLLNRQAFTMNGSTYGTSSRHSNLANNLDRYEGEFDIAYNDRGTNHCGIIRLQLSNNHVDGFSVAGSSTDADGSATIIDGFVSYTGDNAWWLELTTSGIDRGMQVLSEGRFYLNEDSFAGTWRANTGFSGPYTYFKGNGVSRYFGSSSMQTSSYPQYEPLGEAMISHESPSNTCNQTLQEMLEEDIPMAVPLAVATTAYTSVKTIPIAQAVPEK